MQSREVSDEEGTPFHHHQFGATQQQQDLEHRLLEARLRQQQLQSEEDSRWLHM